MDQDTMFMWLQVGTSIIVIVVAILMMNDLVTIEAVRMVVGVVLVGCAGWLAFGDSSRVSKINQMVYNR